MRRRPRAFNGPKRFAWASLAALLAAGPAFAVRAPANQRGDAARFGADATPETRVERGVSRRAMDAVEAFNRRNSGRHNLRFPGGLGLQGSRAATVAVKDVAEKFLNEGAEALGLNPAQLRLELGRSAGGLHHLRFEQIVDGVPVVFSNVRVHLRDDGSILSVRSSYIPGIDARPVPMINEISAAARVSADLPGSSPRGGGLVYFPNPEGGGALLAWRFKASGGGGRWVYYVDAKDGRILSRYNDLRFQVCSTSGTVLGNVFDVDPVTTPGPVVRPIRHQNVYVVDASSAIPTDDNGFYCDPDTIGKISTALQGPYVNVANFNVPNAHYDNGGGVWTTFATPISSPQPYPNSTIHFSTINAPVGAVKVLARFSTFDVGKVAQTAGEYTITDDDQVAVLDAAGNIVATYIGDNRGSFKSASVPGTQLRLRLQSDQDITHNGYTVNISSYLTLANSPTVADNQTATFTWTSARTQDATGDEINLFYHLNLMHDYFARGVNSGKAAKIDKPVPAMARVGPNLANAFYDPEHGNLTFGDVGNGFAFDATVVRHEYVHFVIDQIYPIINFGQFGAISEAFSDYFSASSLGRSAIGKFTASTFGTVGALRELDCVTHGGCTVFPTQWTGSVHEDSRMVSQALWEIRTQMITNLGAANGQSCADGVVWQSLFFFPDSFGDLLDAMLQVSANSATLVPACGANNSQNGLLQAQFSAHGIFSPTVDQDIYEPNDGIVSATDLSSASVISARIFPQADVDYYTFGAGPGEVRLTLGLPENASQPGTYQAYAMTLINSKYEIVAEGKPPLDLNPTLSGFCPDTNCRTSHSEFTLSYANPDRGQFFVMVRAPAGDTGFITNNNSTAFYSLRGDYKAFGPVASGIVSASFDNDLISFTVNVATYVHTQAYSFSYARLRDHRLNVLEGTQTNGPTPFVAFVSSHNALGRITGSVRLAPGFDARYSATGTVFLEIFAINSLGRIQSMGFSNAINLTSKQTSVKAFNNVFNPLKGQATTIKYETQSPGTVTLKLFTQSGRLVSTLIDSYQPAGKGSVDWSGRNFSGSVVASGIYLLQAQGPGLNETKKIIVVK
ncbi:MAG: hypothetical protein AUJ52_05380 [Elusimicrobia bacterium CG1_02_63_36]|nr:MAG: hypothetical protein AUJ52_05380 [Elusimicrobia bacterium CG1_02_63_36]PIP81976.1 MAG: hypothetical protein COR54_17455 [Elusimicrobia bacterium CG22_combo_CG10-13_8_21_14_all_63_91]PJA18465.1 MAG: hypothetical protein COX66_00995 [Elusimicrobia bacterium CG_4_10_14_0_2_um_filter_63_34]PJB24512.1 MAG: hypothetical protein CO113_13565 [Elusimicrobia bacterium CG_4_9_14_3_um_filter_62_55]